MTRQHYHITDSMGVATFAWSDSAERESEWSGLPIVVCQCEEYAHITSAIWKSHKDETYGPSKARN